MADEAVVLDQATAQRMGQATRAWEAQAQAGPPALIRLNGSIEAITVPRSGPDGDGFYTCDIYQLNDDGITYSLLITGQFCRQLPDTL